MPRILNLAKDKQSLVANKSTGVGRVSRYRVWSSDLHIGPIGDVKQVDSHLSPIS